MRILPLLLLLSTLACSPRNEQPNVPTALDLLQDVETTFKSRSYGSDLVDALFQDVLKNDTALAELMKDLAQQRDAHGDSTGAFHRFDEQSTTYYEAARLRIQLMVSDTVQRATQNDMLSRSQAAYNNQVANARELDGRYAGELTRTADLVELIKLQRTLVLMERYQKEQRPDDAVLKSELERIKELEVRLRTMLAQ